MHSCSCKGWEQPFAEVAIELAAELGRGGASLAGEKCSALGLAGREELLPQHCGGGMSFSEHLLLW